MMCMCAILLLEADCGAPYTSWWVFMANPPARSSGQCDPVTFDLRWLEPQLQAPGSMSHTGCTTMQGRRDDFQQNGLVVEA